MNLLTLKIFAPSISSFCDCPTDNSLNFSVGISVGINHIW